MNNQPWVVRYHRRNYSVYAGEEAVCHTCRDSEEAKKEALLIASAPYMLEVLTYLLKDDRLMNSMNRAQAASILEAVRAATGGKNETR